MSEKHRIDVSPEMLSFVGAGALPAAAWPARPVLLQFGDEVVTIDPAAKVADADAALIFVVAGKAVERLAGALPEAASWYLPSALRAQVLAILDPAVGEAIGDTLRLARSIELLCAVFDHLGRGQLVAVAGDCAVSESDAARIAAARRLIDEQWHEKLSLDAIARASGINRGKLTRGFRALYGCSVIDALTERRLSSARAMLAATDLPVSTIGFRCGYLNNASFARAFTRHVGVAPTRWRAARELAA